MDVVFKSNEATIIVNGQKFTGNSFSGNKVGGSVNITGDGVYIDGKLQENSKSLMKDKKIDIQVYGNVEELISYKGDVKVDQDVGKLEVRQGDAKIGSDVLGDAVCTQGDLDIGRDVAGNAKTNMGDLDIGGNVGGTAKTNMGDLTIKQKKAKEELKCVEAKKKKPESLFNLD